MSILSSNDAGIDSVIEGILKKAFYGSLFSHPIVGIMTTLNDFQNHIGSVYELVENQENNNPQLGRSLAHKEEEKCPHKVETYEAQIGRPMVTFDSSHFAKYDAIGTLKTMSELSINPQKKPIILIENITDISSHEDRDILIHSWLNGERTLIDNRPTGDGKPFTINPQNYTIIFTWQPGTLDKLSEVWPDYEKYMIIKGLEQEFKNFKDKYKLENYDTDKTKRRKDILSKFCNE